MTLCWVRGSRSRQSSARIAGDFIFSGKRAPLDAPRTAEFHFKSPPLVLAAKSALLP
jgi:hypothetical protein